MKITNHLGRRRFLSALGASAATLPIARAMLRGEVARAQGSPSPVRFLAFRNFHGTYRDFWIPKTTAGGAPASADEALSTLTFDYPNAILSPLESWRDHITVLDGIDHAVLPEILGFGGHESVVTGLTGYGNRDTAGGPSVDSVIVDRLGSTVGTHLVNGVWTVNDYRTLNFDMAGRPLVPEENPNNVFRSVFGSGGGGGSMDPAQAQRAALQRSVLDHSLDDVNRLQSMLTGNERAKLEAYLEGLRLLEGRLSRPAVVDCGSLTAPGDPGRANSQADWQWIESTLNAMIDVTAQALICDVSRVASINMLGGYQSPELELPTQTRVNEINHGGAYHAGVVHEVWRDPSDALLNVYATGQRWTSTFFARILETLNVPDPADPDSGRTVLDNTVIYWTNEFGNGGHAYEYYNVPVIIGGGGGGTIRSGRYLRLRQPDATQLVPHNRALTSMCHAMGLSDVDFVGDPRVSSNADYRGPLAELMT